MWDDNDSRSGPNHAAAVVGAIDDRAGFPYQSTELYAFVAQNR
jgi:hypothetical protein